jgi:DNA-directed RNA polymerase II subunit RPB3
MISFTNFDKSENDTIRFDVENCNPSFVNSIRRTIITDVQSVSFDTEDYNNSDLQVLKNTTSLHNEFILHRMGMIPVNVENMDNYNPDMYKFILNKSNKTQNIIDVTTNDIEVLNLETNEKEETEKYFPKNPITGDHILIIKLKPNPNGDGQEIHLEGKSSKKSGSSHIRYSPVSNVVFINKKDSDLLNVEFNKYIYDLQEERGTKITESEIKTLGKTFEIENGERYFYTDDNNDPNRFEFTIESVGVIEPHRILMSSMKSLADKLKNVLMEIEKELSGKPSTIKIKESESVMKAFDVVIDGETHTLGHLLQSYINRIYKEQNIFVGYMNPHPLQNEIFLRIKTDDLNMLREIITNTCNILIESLLQLREVVLKEFEGKVVMKMKKGRKSKKAEPEPESTGLEPQVISN